MPPCVGLREVFRRIDVEEDALRIPQRANPVEGEDTDFHAIMEADRPAVSRIEGRGDGVTAGRPVGRAERLQPLGPGASGRKAS